MWYDRLRSVSPVTDEAIRLHYTEAKHPGIKQTCFQTKNLFAMNYTKLRPLAPGEEKGAPLLQPQSQITVDDLASSAGAASAGLTGPTTACSSEPKPGS